MNWIILLLLFCSCGNRCCVEHECDRHEDCGCGCKPERPCACEPCRERSVCDIVRDRDEGCVRDRDRNDGCGILRDRDNCSRERDRDDRCSCGRERDRDDGGSRDRCDIPGITPPSWNNRSVRGETCGCEE